MLGDDAAIRDTAPLDPFVISMDRGALQYFFGKDKLPEGWSYPLKRSVLDAALRAADVTCVFSVRYSYGRGKQLYRPLRVQFDGEELRRSAAGTVNTTVYAVPSAERQPIMTQLESKLAAVCDWIGRAETAPPTWRMKEHVLDVDVRDGRACVVESR